jgi:hypothetical protein
MGVRLTNMRTIVFIIDNGPSQQPYLADVNRAVLNSLETMPTSRSIHIEYWDSSAAPSYPANGLTAVNDNSVAAAVAAMINTPALTDPDPDAAIKKAVSLKPNAIVLITGRTFDDATRDRLLAEFKGPASKVFAFSINSPTNSTLQAIATTTGGQYTDITTARLSTYAK